MKKFQFSLDTVLDYKQQVLTSLQSEHGAILLRVRQQEEVLEQTEHAHRELNEEFTRRRAEGISIKDALMLESGLRVLERDIDREAQKLLALQKQEEKKRDEVIEAKKRDLVSGDAPGQEAGAVPQGGGKTGRAVYRGDRDNRTRDGGCGRIKIQKGSYTERR